MDMVRQRMIKPFNLFILMSLMTLSACNVTEITGTNARSNIVNNNNGQLDNKAYIYADNPYILGGGNVSASNPNMGKYLSRTPELITTNTSLTGNCGIEFFFYYGNYLKSLPNCIRSLGTREKTTPTSRKEVGV